jgi:GNAT superfamily N-acetyltransferase
MNIRPIEQRDRATATSILEESWGTPQIVSRGVVHNALELPALVAETDSNLVGLLTYHIANGECEVVSLNANSRHQGVGTALLASLVEIAQRQRCNRVWLVTTNDNVDALRFYQRRGFTLRALHRNALEQSRLLKPGIPSSGDYGIPLRDELELEYSLGAKPC